MKGTKASKFRQTTFKFASGEVENFDLKHLKIQKEGEEGTIKSRIFYYYEAENGKKQKISPWHDIPLYALGQGEKGKIFHFVCEIPKWTRAKFEIATKELYNPIKQDVKNGKLRFYQHGDMCFNYGAFPQTWEDPNHISETGKPGDNDPIDVIEIGTKQVPSGGVVEVKILGVLALIDDGETDWKVLTIQVSDPLSKVLNDVGDIENEIPGLIDSIREWLRVYKVCTGKKPNSYGFNGECKNKKYATEVVLETHSFWKQLRDDKKDVVSTPLPINERKFDWTSFQFDSSQELFKQ